MGREPERKTDGSAEQQRDQRPTQFPQESWTEIDAEGTDSEMAQGRQKQEPFYTPLVNEAAERRRKKEQAERSRQEDEASQETDQRE